MKKLPKLLRTLPKTATPKKVLKKSKVDTTPNPEPMSPYTKDKPAPSLVTNLSITGPWPNRDFTHDGKWNTGITVLGLDPSLRGFGICQLNERLQVHRTETWDGGKKLVGRERMTYLITKLEHLVTNLKGTRRLYVVREDYAYSQSDAADTPLKELGGVIRWITEAKVPLYSVGIQSIKKFVSGNGNSKKEEMMRDALKNFGFEGDQNQVDALGVSLLSMAVLCRDRITGLNKAQKDVIQSMVAKGHPLTTVT